MATAGRTKPISDEAVEAKTGKAWAEWFRTLDGAGAKRMTHTEIATHLHEKCSVPGWWCQMVAVRYEQERGMRKVLQTCRGDFAATGSRTLAAPLAKAFRAVADPGARRTWCPDAPLEVTSKTEGKYVRAKWGDTKERVAFYFVAEGPAKSKVQVDHQGIASEKDARFRKAWWGERLDRLRERVGG